MAEQNFDKLEGPMPSKDTKLTTDSDMDSSSVSPNIDLSETSILDGSSPNKSRYGRSHKPKSPGDFLSHDKRVSAIMRISPFNQMQYYNFPKERKKNKIPKKTISQAPEEIEEDYSEIDKNCWRIGDLVWAKIGRHPYWPAMIDSDPDMKPSKRHLRKGRYSSLEIHVMFYADNGRRSWIARGNIIPFQSRTQFLKLQRNLSVRLKTKEFRKSGCHIKPSILDWWKSAVVEAEEQKERTREERMEFFNQMLTGVEKSKESPAELKLRGSAKFHATRPISKDIIIAMVPPRKRKLLDDLNNSPAKQPKYEKKVEELKRDSKKEEKVIPPTTPLRTIADRKKRQATLLELARSSGVITPPSKKIKDNPKVHVPEITKSQKSKNSKDTYKAVSKIEKKKTKKQKLDNDFNFYCTKHFNRTKDDYPEMSNKEIYKLLGKIWTDMDNTQRSRYRARLTTVQNIVRPETDDSQSDVETGNTSENSDQNCEANEAAPGPIAAATSKGGVGKRVISLFSGAKAEKACLICETPGDTVRCHGPCNGYYHMKCIIIKKNNPDYKVEEKIEIKKKNKGRKGKQDKTFLKNIEEPSTSRDNNLSVALRNEEISGTSFEMEVTIDTGKVSNVSQNTELSPSKTSRKGSKDSDSEDGDDFRCPDCLDGKTQPCFVCNNYSDPKNSNTKMHRCHTARCGKVYHLNCLKAWPQTTWSSGRRTIGKNDGEGVMTCPQHCCHTCVSDNPAVVKARYTNDKIVRCLKCPTSYHYGNHCIPAGSEIISQTQIICPLHYKPRYKKGIFHVNAAWCFICASGGSLICCDLCPTAFHADCLNISPPDGGYVCEDCQTGRFPLYGEIVWVKLGSYRWWPAEIIYPALVPENILNLPHVRGEFAVRFFGSHDYYWVNRGRVFIFHENDKGSKTTKKSSVDTVFAKAVQEALVAQERVKADKALRDAEVRPGMKPPSYVKIKSNKSVGNVRTVELNISNMTPCECKPDSKNPCAPDSDCLNRLLMVECNPLVCPAGDRCNNQLFEKRVYPLLQPFQTEGRGWGLKTFENIKKGDFVIEYVGEMIDEIEYKKRLARLHATNDENYYFLTIDKDRLLDAGPKGNVSRFMNHSCQPNCETQKWTVNGDTRVGLFALCDITAGTELVFNYNLEPFGNDKKPCMCGAPNCSGFIGVKANKQTNEDDKKIKSGKKKAKHPVKVSDEECFICHEIGELILCDNKTCPKAYHMECLKKTKKPQGFWVCPWHHCTVCNKGRVRRCSVCVNSYCQDHSEGNIQLHDEEGLLCNKHYKEGVNGGTISIPTSSVEFQEATVDSATSTVNSDQLSYEVKQNIVDSVIEHENNLKEESECNKSVINESEPIIVQFKDDINNCRVEFNLISVVNGNRQSPDNDSVVNKCEDLIINATTYVDEISTSITNSHKSSIDCSSSQNVYTKNVSSNEQIKTSCNNTISDSNDNNAKTDIVVTDKPLYNNVTTVVKNTGDELQPREDDGESSDPTTSTGDEVEPKEDCAKNLELSDLTTTSTGDEVEPKEDVKKSNLELSDLTTTSTRDKVEPKEDCAKNLELSDLTTTSTGDEVEPKKGGGESSDPTTSTGDKVEPKEDGGESSDPTTSTGDKVEPKEDCEKSNLDLSDLTTTSTGDELEPREDSGESSDPTTSTGDKVEPKEDSAKSSLELSDLTTTSTGDEVEPKEDVKKSNLELSDLTTTSTGDEVEPKEDVKKSNLELSDLTTTSTGDEVEPKEDVKKSNLELSDLTTTSTGDESQFKEDGEQINIPLKSYLTTTSTGDELEPKEGGKKSNLDLCGLSINTGSENENILFCLNVNEPSSVNNNSFNENTIIGVKDGKCAP